MLLLLTACPCPAAAGDGAPLPDGVEVRRRLESILASGEYATGPEGDATPLLAEWFFRKLRAFFDAMGRLGVEAPVLFWALLVGCLAVLAAIVAHAGVVLVGALRAARAPPRAGGGEEAPSEDPSAVLARGRDEAGRGAYAEALRLVHRAALLGLERRGLVRFRESLTSGDFLLQLRKAPRERTAFESLRRVYEPAVFGRIPVDRPACERCLRLAEALVAEPPR